MTHLLFYGVKLTSVGKCI